MQTGLNEKIHRQGFFTMPSGMVLPGIFHPDKRGGFGINSILFFILANSYVVRHSA
jgi:hypothetical protein